MKAVDYLVEGRKLIDNPDNWTTEEMARARDGFPVDVCAQEAVCWCSEGALENAYWRLTPDYDRQPYNEAIAILADAAKDTGDVIGGPAESVVNTYNDASSHGEVLAVWDRAIAMAKAENA